jgi:catecholate siderophore receptor
VTKQGKLGTWSARSANLVALGMLALGTVATPGIAAAEPKEPHGGKQDGQAATFNFDIPAGQLSDALKQFRQTTGIGTALHLPPEEITGFHSKGVKGNMTFQAALNVILEDTGLGFQMDRGGTRADIQIQNQEQVSVVASANSVALSQFTESLTDTAQTVNVVPQYILQEQAVTSLRDSLRNAPGISLAAGEAGAQGDNLTIRGFSARNDIYLDGIRDFGSYYRDSFAYESVDVLQGPASVEFGRGSTGGVVNQETKQAVSNKFVRPNIQGGTNGMIRGTVDANVPLSDFIPHAAIRVNAMGMRTNVALRNDVVVRRWGVAPSINFGLGTATRGVINYLHEQEDSLPDYGLPYFGAGLPSVAQQNFYGLTSGNNFIRTTPEIFTGKVEHDFGANWTGRSTLRYGYYPRNVRVTEPQVNTAGVVTGVGSPVNGVYAAYVSTCSPTAATTAGPCYALNTPLSQVQVRRATIDVHSVEDNLWTREEMIGHVHTGKIEHDLSIAIEGGRERSSPVRKNYTLSTGFVYYNYTPLLSPNSSDPFAPPTFTTTTTHVASQSFAFNVLDTVKVTRWLQFSGGIRFDYFNTNSVGYTPTAASCATGAPATNVCNFSHLDKKPTYRAAVVVKPTPNGSVYFDYGTSFNPSAESLSLSANSVSFPPEENTTYEAGTKWDYFSGKMNLNASIFRTEKLNARETDPLNSLNSILSGTQLVRGAQIGIVGHLPQHLDVIMGYAYLNGIIESSVVNASPFSAINVQLINAHDPRANTAPFYLSPKGFPFANVPKNSGNVWVTHALPWHFVGGFGGNYVAARRASSTGITALSDVSAAVPIQTMRLAFKQIPDYVAFNAMLQRPITERLQFQVNVQNLTNKFFIDQPHPNHLVPGEGINAQFTVNYNF